MAGVLLMIIGLGLVYGNVMRIRDFEIAYQTDSAALLATEFARIERTLQEYRTIVFKGIPMIIIAARLVILFLNSPKWLAIGITTIAMMAVILLVDGTAHARIQVYKSKLDTVGENGDWILPRPQ